MRISLETDGRALFNYPFLNQRMDAVEELLDHPRMAIGLGDSGARRADHGRVAPDLVPAALGPRPAQVHDRGRHPPHDLRHRAAVRHRRPGRAEGRRVRRRQRPRPRRARAALPEFVHDFPSGAGRYVQRADGYRTTVVNGAVFVEDGEPTGAHAGHTLRSSPMAKI